MRSSDDLRKRIESLIHDYCCDSSKEPPYLKGLAERYHVLPIYIDWTVFFGLRPDGEIVLVPTEEQRDPEPEVDERWRRVAIFRSTKKYPELIALIPARPLGAPDCPHCEGHGRIDIPGVEPDTIVCYCGGFGWLTEEEVLAERRANSHMHRSRKLRGTVMRSVRPRKQPRIRRLK